jgi:hypothetical protein
MQELFSTIMVGWWAKTEIPGAAVTLNFDDNPEKFGVGCGAKADSVARVMVEELKDDGPRFKKPLSNVRLPLVKPKLLPHCNFRFNSTQLLLCR